MTAPQAQAAVTNPQAQAELCVLLTPRELGGHEAALLGWLGDAARTAGLRAALVAPTALLRQACQAAGLGDSLLPLSDRTWPRAQVLAALQRWPRGTPVLLAPGVLHVAAWLLAAAVALGHRVWVYVPMCFSAARMGFRGAALRDAALAPWLRGVERWITVQPQQARLLTDRWGLSAPVHVLPNRARLPVSGPQAPSPAADGRLRLAWVGRFDPWQKGLDWLTQTLATDTAFSRGVHWRFQGRGDFAGVLHRLQQKLGPDCMQVHAHAPIDEALAQSDALLLCSRFEGLPLVALEATARGWPVLASVESGLSDLLPPSSQFHFGDAAGLRRAVALFADPAQRHRAVDHARERLAHSQAALPYADALNELTAALRAAPRAQTQPC